MENEKKKGVKISTDKKGNQKIRKSDLEKALKVKKLSLSAGSYDYRPLFKKKQCDYEQLMYSEMWKLTDEVFKLTGHIARLNIAMNLIIEKLCGKDLNSVIEERKKLVSEQLERALAKKDNEKN